jgi:hypothetical protein
MRGSGDQRLLAGSGRGQRDGPDVRVRGTGYRLAVALGVAVQTGWRRVALLVVAVLVLVPGVLSLGRIPGAEPVRGMTGAAGFHHRVGTAQDAYGEDEPVRLSYEVCRTRPWPARTLSGQVPVIAEFRILDQAGGVVADTSHRSHTLLLTSVRWWPGQCRSVASEWDQRYWNQHPPDEQEQRRAGTPRRGERVEPGTYRFEVRWDVSVGDEPDDLMSDAITTDTFELLP